MIAVCRAPGGLFRSAGVFFVGEQLLTGGAALPGDSALGLLARFHLAKKLFAHEEHSYTEPVPRYVLVVPLAGADLHAIPLRVAFYDHSGAVAVAPLHLVLGKALLDLVDDFGV